MLTGRVPFSSDSEFDLMKMQIEDAPAPPRVFAAHIPPSVEQAIMRSLAKRSEARFQTAAEFRNVLSNAVGTLAAPTISVPSVSAAPPARPTEPISASTVAENIPRETRLANEAPTAFAADQMKQTRLAGDVNVLGASASAGAMFQPAPVASPSKSNAKLFIGIAAVALIAVVGVSVALLSGGKKQAATQTAQPAPSVQSTPSSAAPSSGASQPPPPVQPLPQPVTQLEPGKSPADKFAGATLPAGENANASKATKTARKESDAEAAARKEKARKAAEARRLLNQ
jgi:serine/threonine-protein kinase